MIRLAALALPLLVQIPAGSYRPLYSTAGEVRVAVAAFQMDRDYVSRRSFAAFVVAHPAWRRDSVRRVFADDGYLADWAGPLDAGTATWAERPATQVSWFAARAYCATQGGRLPTVDEWEYVAAASATQRDASNDPAYRQHVLALYTTRVARAAEFAPAHERNVYGIRDLHGAVWEWTLDFNSVVVGDDSRAFGSGVNARDNHLYCASAALGATDPSDYPAFLRSAVRAGLTARTTMAGLGFRCAA
jgi:sulfatase modifying factor 1